MKYFFLLISLALCSSHSFSQQPKTNTKKPTAPKTSSAKANSVKTPASKKPAPKPAVKKDEKAELEKALALEDPQKKAASLVKFLVDFPKSESRAQVIEALTTARVTAAQAKFASGDRESAIKIARQALEEAPAPYPDKLFSETISKIPILFLSLGDPTAAYETAAVIEKNAGTNVSQLLALSQFYLSNENGTEAKRIAEAAVKLDEKSAAAYQTLGMANRMNFDLEASTAAYEKAVELDPESVSNRQSLAEMKRALGKPDEAIAIFSTLIEKDATDLRSINGRILSLFDSGKKSDAEAEFAKVIEAEPGNFVLLAGAAYWYAANNEHAKAIDLAGKAITAEPRYIWSHIALARGLSGEERFMDAEQALLKAKKYGNFPTLDYELASMKFASGFYREAAEELTKSFTFKDGAIVTRLGRRVERSDKNFIELLSAERRASILEPKAADRIEIAEKMKALLEFRSLLSERSPDEARASEAATAFADGTDKMRFHRQVFAANQLVERSLAPAKVLDLSKAAIASVDDGLSIAMPASPIMASELYASRVAAIADDKYLVVPEVPKQTLSAIARGRIEELAGAALIQQKNNPEAVIRLRRAVNILPEKSAWWRTSLWRLGTALEADGKDKDALDAYVKSYTSAEPEAEKYSVIAGVYQRVNQNSDGLEALIGANPLRPAEKAADAAPPAIVETKSEVSTETKNDASVGAKPESTVEKKSEPVPDKTVVDGTPIQPEKELPKVIPTSVPSPEPEVKKAEEEKQPEQKLDPAVESLPKPKEEIQKEPDPKPTPATEPSPKSVETIQRSEDNTPKSKEESAPKHEEEKTPEPKATPKPLFEPVVIEIKGSSIAKPSEKVPEKSSESESESDQKEDRSGASRTRVVEGKDVTADAAPRCALSVSQDNISLIGGGGSVGILVGVDNGDVKEIKFESSSTKDVEVTAEPEIAGVSGRLLFVVRSLTATAGVYKVVFTSPCGKKEVVVRVR